MNYIHKLVVVGGIHDTWCADLVEMQQKWNCGVRYLLVVLDILSKYGWAIPITSKKGNTVAGVFI